MRELRVPLTLDKQLFHRATKIGRELLFLHTYGERFAAGQTWPAPAVKNLKAIASGVLPDKFSYDDVTRVIHVGDGVFGPVSQAVWDFEVSGLKVVQSWLGYRMKNRKGKKSSPLDDITPKAWTSDYTTELLRLLNLLTRTVELQPAQVAVLDSVLASPLLDSSSLGPVPRPWRAAPGNAPVHQDTLDL